MGRASGDVVPKTPEAVTIGLRQREFTAKADVETVIELYQKGNSDVLEICGGEIDYKYAGFGEQPELREHFEYVANLVRGGKVRLPVERSGKVRFSMTRGGVSAETIEMLMGLHSDVLEIVFD